MSKQKQQDVKTLSDNEIVDLIMTTGKTDLFSELYDRYANKIFRKAISIVGDRQVAETLAHDILVRTFVNIHSFKQKSKFSTWIYRISYNYCIQYLRDKKRYRTSDIDDVSEGKLIEETDGVTEKEILEIELGLLSQLLGELSPEDRAILLMRYQDEMSLEEIEESLEIGKSATKMRLKRARDRLGKLYRKHHAKFIANYE